MTPKSTDHPADPNLANLPDPVICKSCPSRPCLKCYGHSMTSPRPIVVSHFDQIPMQCPVRFNRYLAGDLSLRVSRFSPYDLKVLGREISFGSFNNPQRTIQELVEADLASGKLKVLYPIFGTRADACLRARSSSNWAVALAKAEQAVHPESEPPGKDTPKPALHSPEWAWIKEPKKPGSEEKRLAEGAALDYVWCKVDSEVLMPGDGITFSIFLKGREGKSDTKITTISGRIGEGRKDNMAAAKWMVVSQVEGKSLDAKKDSFYFIAKEYSNRLEMRSGVLKLADEKPKVEIIHVGIFFDGTNNNRNRDRPLKHDTNVSKLYDLFHFDKKTRYAFYLEGVGTGSWLNSDPISGGLNGRGIYDRILRAENSLKDITKKHPGCEIRLSVFGFSRGSATALGFINHLFDQGASKPVQSSASGGSEIHFGLPPPATPSTNPKDAAKQLGFEKVWFVGLFDTVASIGLPGDDAEFIHDVTAKQSRIRKLTHFVARDERRGLFPCTSIHTGSGVPLPSGWEERTFPGVHSDVGGGYEDQIMKTEISSHGQGQDISQVTDSIKIHKGDYLSRVAGWAMYDAAVKAEVPMYSIEDTQPSSGSAQNVFDNILKSGIIDETSKNGWTTFKLPDGTNSIPEGLKEALNLLSIPLSLFKFWKSRGSESTKNSLMDVHHPDFKDNIYPYIHDSLDLKDPKGISQVVGINPSPRTILYRGLP